MAGEAPQQQERGMGKKKEEGRAKQSDQFAPTYLVQCNYFNHNIFMSAGGQQQKKPGDGRDAGVKKEVRVDKIKAKLPGNQNKNSGEVRVDKIKDKLPGNQNKNSGEVRVDKIKDKLPGNQNKNSGEVRVDKIKAKLPELGGEAPQQQERGMGKKKEEGRGKQSDQFAPTYRVQCNYFNHNIFMSAGGQQQKKPGDGRDAGVKKEVRVDKIKAKLPGNQNKNSGEVRVDKIKDKLPGNQNEKEEVRVDKIKAKLPELGGEAPQQQERGMGKKKEQGRGKQSDQFAPTYRVLCNDFNHNIFMIKGEGRDIGVKKEVSFDKIKAKLPGNQNKNSGEENRFNN